MDLKLGILFCVNSPVISNQSIKAYFRKLKHLDIVLLLLYNLMLLYKFSPKLD